MQHHTPKRLRLSTVSLLILLALLLGMTFALDVQAQDKDKAINLGQQSITAAIKDVVADTVQIKAAIAEIDSLIVAHKAAYDAAVKPLRAKKSAGNALLRNLRKLAK